MAAQAESSLGSILAAAGFVAAALAALAVALHRLELGQGARRRRRLRQAMAAAERERARTARLQQATRASPEPLSPRDLSRLAAFRPRARLMAGEPLGKPGWVAKLQHLWRDGHSGWIIAALVGAFSMATHFGAYWLIAGGGWLGATLVTLGSTVLMTAACFWVLLGLVSPRS
jgi:hypothetical protein